MSQLTKPQKKLLEQLAITGNHIKKDRMIYRFHLYTRAGTFIETVHNPTFEKLLRLGHITRVSYNQGISYEYQISVSGFVVLGEQTPARNIKIEQEEEK